MNIGGNLFAWLAGGTRYRELSDTRSTWNQVEALRRSCRVSQVEFTELVLPIVNEAAERFGRRPQSSIMIELSLATDTVLRAEDIGELEANWRAIEEDVACATEVRQMLVRRRRWMVEFDRMYEIVRRQLIGAYETLFAALPKSCFGYRDPEAEAGFEVPLIELVDDPARVVHELVTCLYSDETLGLNIFEKLRTVMVTNLLVASGFRATPIRTS